MDKVKYTLPQNNHRLQKPKFSCVKFFFIERNTDIVLCNKWSVYKKWTEIVVGAGLDKSRGSRKERPIKR